jgi:hypothetical protein
VSTRGRYLIVERVDQVKASPDRKNRRVEVMIREGCDGEAGSPLASAIPVFDADNLLSLVGLVPGRVWPSCQGCLA